MLGCFHSFGFLNADAHFLVKRSHLLPQNSVMEQLLQSYLLDTCILFLASEHTIDVGISVRDTHQASLWTHHPVNFRDIYLGIDL